MIEENHKFIDSAVFAAFIEHATFEKIFHITRHHHYLSMLRDGYIRGGQNPERNWPTYSSFFVNMGCVCVTNNRQSYRVGMPESDAGWHSTSFRFSSANFISEYYGNTAVFLILSDEIEKELISWSLWKKQRKLSEKVIPYYEAGYKGNIPLSKIEKEYCSI